MKFSKKRTNKSIFKNCIYSILPLIILILLSETLLYFFDIGAPLKISPKLWPGTMHMMEYDPFTGLKMIPYASDNSKVKAMSARTRVGKSRMER